jgi:hypothetical protein
VVVTFISPCVRSRVARRGARRPNRTPRRVDGTQGKKPKPGGCVARRGPRPRRKKDRGARPVFLSSDTAGWSPCLARGARKSRGEELGIKLAAAACRRRCVMQLSPPAIPLVKSPLGQRIAVHSKKRPPSETALVILQDHSLIVVAGDAIEGTLTLIWTLTIKPGKHHRRTTLWARRSFIARVWKVRIGRHE